MNRRNSSNSGDGEWDVEHERYERTEYVGMMQEDAPVFYAPEDRSVFRGEMNAEEGRVTPIEGSEESLGAEETVGQAIERLGDAVGWESLSEFAREHLEKEGKTVETDSTDERN